jgi:hypothetical protein
MVYLLFVLGFILYAFSAWFMYQNHFKDQWFFLPVSISAGILGSILWGTVAKITLATNELYMRGLIWDAMLVGCYTLLPFFWGVKLSMTSYVGVGITVVGLVLTKMG